MNCFIYTVDDEFIDIYIMNYYSISNNNKRKFICIQKNNPSKILTEDSYADSDIKVLKALELI